MLSTAVARPTGHNRSRLTSDDPPACTDIFNGLETSGTATKNINQAERCETTREAASRGTLKPHAASASPSTANCLPINTSNSVDPTGIVLGQTTGLDQRDDKNGSSMARNTNEHRDAPAQPVAKKRPVSDNTGQSDESSSEPCCKRPRRSERVKERNIKPNVKPEKSCVKSEKSSHEVICPLCHSPLSLPSPLTLPFYKTLRAPNCRRIIRDHCRNTLDHDMLWEVAERGDFVTNDELRRHPDVSGPSLVLVQSLLKVGINSDATGIDALIVLLTRWSDFLDTKGN